MVACLIKLYSNLITTTTSQMLEQVSKGTAVDISHQSNCRQLWCSMLAFGHWLGVAKPLPPLMGRRLVAKVMATNTSQTNYQLSGLCVDSLAILIQELILCDESGRLLHLEAIVATYVAFWRLAESNGKSYRQPSGSISPLFIDWRIQLDFTLSKACKSISAQEFSHTLDLCSESLSAGGISHKDLKCLVHLTGLLMHEAPQGNLPRHPLHYKLIESF